MTHKISNEIMLEKLNYNLNDKIKYSLNLINQFYKNMDGNVYIAYSGGKDSIVLLDLVRKCYPDVLAVFIDTGLEFKSLKDNVKKTDNVKVLRPNISFYQVIKKYGYPIISKEVSKNISRYRNSNNKDVKLYRKYGIRKNGTIGKFGVIPKKHHYLIDAPFKISDMCCECLKKKPIKIFEKKYNLKPFIGIKASDSLRRKFNWLKLGCNIFKINKEKSHALSIWNDNDVWKYIKINKLNYPNVYDKGEHNTGCIFCLFGIHLEKYPNRIQRLKYINRKLYYYGLNKLNLKTVLDYMNIDYSYNKLEDFF
jgi:3'-phosphoadenosine 5'-phosphosulfate sulfotransferase (PAPS reductase)/FAD synthetase